MESKTDSERDNSEIILVPSPVASSIKATTPSAQGSRLLLSFEKIHPQTLALVAFALATLFGPSEDAYNKYGVYTQDVAEPLIQLTSVFMLIVIGDSVLRKTNILDSFDDNRTFNEKVKPLLVMFGAFLAVSHASSMIFIATSFSGSKLMNLTLSESQDSAVDALVEDFIEKATGFIGSVLALSRFASNHIGHFYKKDFPKIILIFSAFFTPGLLLGIVRVISGYEAPAPVVLLPSLSLVFFAELYLNMPKQAANYRDDSQGYHELEAGPSGATP